MSPRKEVLPPPSASDAPEVVWSALSDRGRVRANNEDAFLGLAFDGHEVLRLGKTGRAGLAAHDFVFAVSDGMGGARAGEFASRIAVDHLTRLLPRGFRRATTVQSGEFATLLGGLFAAIHHDLLRLGQSYEECAGMGATLSLAWFTPGRIFFGHVGDSRLYHLPKGGGLVQLTHDHTYPGWLRRKGEINEREAREHPMRHALQQALGAGQQIVDPQFGSASHSPGDRFLLCTDGLADGLWDRQIEEQIREPAPEHTVEPTASRLVAAAVQNSGRDNTTAVVVELAGDKT